MANVVYLESPWGSWNLVTISPSLELIAPATEAPGHSTALQPTVSVAWAATLPPPAPKAFEVATGNSSSVGPTPSKAVFLVSKCVKHYQIQKGSGLWWYNITLDFGDIGKERKRQKKLSGPFHSITRLFIRRESWSPSSNSHLFSPILLCLQSENSNGREGHHHLEKHMSCYGIDSSNCWKYLPSVEPNSAFQWLTSIVSIESHVLHA